MKNLFDCMYIPIQKDIEGFHLSANMKPQSDSLPYHRHNAYEIYLFLHGNVNMCVEHSCHHLTYGDLFIICPSEMHRSICLDSQHYERIGINVKCSVLERLSSLGTDLMRCFEYHKIGQNNLIHLSEEQTNFFIGMTDQLCNALHSTGYGYDVLANAYLIQLLVLINIVYQNSTYTAENILPKLVHDTMVYVKEHLKEKITLKQLSQNFYMNGTYISSQFKKHTGIPLRYYILDQRIALAKELLNSGEDVSEACYCSGFSDYANFIRSFTKIVGTSPGKFRKIN